MATNRNVVDQVSIAPQRLLLAGLMGSGKTTVGRIVAERLDWPYRDNDERVAEIAGITSDRVAAELGVDRLHEIEEQIVNELLVADAPYVGGIPGSALDHAALSTRMHDEATVVWLNVPVEVLAERVGHDPARPLLDRDQEHVEEVLGEQLERRRPMFVRASDFVIAADSQTPEELAELIIAELSR